MEIIEAPLFRQQLLDYIAKKQFRERTGVHQGDLVYCLNKTARAKMNPVELTDEELLIFSLGFATQNYLTGKDDDEPEIEVDGIKVTLDALTQGGIEGSKSVKKRLSVQKPYVPWECKATYQSSNKPIEDNIHWLRQCMAQCYVTGTTVAYLSRFQLMGNWSWIFSRDPEIKAASKRPTLGAWYLKFTQKELDANWAWLKERKVLFEAILETGKYLPKVIALASGQTWECKYCKCQLLECKEEEPDETVD